MIAHEALVELASRRDEQIVRRTLALGDFITGPGRTALEEGELLVAIECDALPGYGGSFEKVGHRRSLVISLVCLAALVKLDAAKGRLEDVRLAIGGIGPVPRRLAEVEASCVRDRSARRDWNKQPTCRSRWSPRARARSIAARWCAASCCAG